jgi:hypothetical protein
VALVTGDVTATRPQHGALRRGVRDPRLLTSLVFVASAVLMAAVRAWQIAGRGAVWWNDSAPLLVVGAATVALALPHALVSWHSDGMETARHLMVPTLQLYLGLS